ncbi:MAG: hypothetical protein AB8F95_09330 [Bacteroidia bacterium]
MGNRRIWLGLGGFILLLVLGWLITKALKDKQHPDWTALDQRLVAPYSQAAALPDSLQQLWNEHHHVIAEDDSLAWRIFSTPFAPSLSWKKWKQWFKIVQKQRFVTVSGVSGAGATTLFSRLAASLVSSQEHLLEVRCAPRFDLEYHRQYIGYRNDDGKFQKGEILKLMEKCEQHPQEHFIVYLDNFDKINPETFFGPELWEKLDDARFECILGGKAIEIPSNLTFIALVHTGASSRIKLNNEHFRRLGGLHVLAPSEEELILYLREKKKEAINENDSESLVYLNDSVGIKHFVFAFTHINGWIEKEYGSGYQLGQWSSVRKLYEKPLEETFKVFANHVSALKPENQLSLNRLEPIRYRIENEGAIKHSNWLATQFRMLEAKGFLTEFVVGLSFLLITGLFSFWFLRKRKKSLRSKLAQAYGIMERFEKQLIDVTDADKQMKEVKQEVDNMVSESKLDYQEAVFFYVFLEDKMKRLEIARSTHENFRQLVDVFLEDGVLSESEYEKLQQFLEQIKPRISEAHYAGYAEEIAKLRQEYRG